MFILHRQSYTPISIKVALGIIVLWSLKAIVWWSLRQSLIALYSALQWPNPKATFIEIGVCSTRLSSLESPDIEAIWLRIPVNSSVFIVGTVYRPPSDSLFFDRFQVILEKLWIKRRNVVIIGPLNYDSPRLTDGSLSSTSGQKLHDFLSQFDYMVINDKPTRVTSNTSTLIGLVISNKRNLIYKKTRQQSSLESRITCLCMHPSKERSSGPLLT